MEWESEFDDDGRMGKEFGGGGERLNGFFSCKKIEKKIMEKRIGEENDELMSDDENLE